MDFRKIDLCAANSSTSDDEISVMSAEINFANKKHKSISEKNTEKFLIMKQAHFEEKKKIKECFVSALREIQRSKEENAERRHQEKLAVKQRENDLLEQLINKL